MADPACSQNSPSPASGGLSSSEGKEGDHGLRAEPRPRGGRRPRAGAPKGNLNALRHGLRSKQFLRFTLQLFRDPVAQKFLLGKSPGQRPLLDRERAVKAAAALVRHAKGEDVPDIQAVKAVLKPLSRSELRIIAKELAAQTIKERGKIQIPHDDFYFS